MLVGTDFIILSIDEAHAIYKFIQKRIVKDKDNVPNYKQLQKEGILDIYNGVEKFLRRSER